MPTPTLFILGTAIDGPLREPTAVSNFEEACRIFGGDFTESHQVGPSDTQLWLAYRARANSLRAYQAADTRLVPLSISHLRRDDINHNLACFDCLGYSQPIVLQYRREFVEGELLQRYEEALLALAQAPVRLVRISGLTATTGLPYWQPGTQTPN